MPKYARPKTRGSLNTPVVHIPTPKNEKIREQNESWNPRSRIRTSIIQDFFIFLFLVLNFKSWGFGTQQKNPNFNDVEPCGGYLSNSAAVPCLSRYSTMVHIIFVFITLLLIYKLCFGIEGINCTLRYLMARRFHFYL